MKHLKLFELYHSPEFDVKYYWRVTINRITDFFKEFDIQRKDEDGCIILTISNKDKSCEIKFDHTNCFLNGEKTDTRINFFKNIRSCLEQNQTEQ